MQNEIDRQYSALASFLHRDMGKRLAFVFHLSEQEVSKVLPDTLRSPLGEFELTREPTNEVLGGGEQAKLDIPSLVPSAYLNAVVMGCSTSIDQSDSAHSPFGLCPGVIVHLA